MVKVNICRLALDAIACALDEAQQYDGMPFDQPSQKNILAAKSRTPGLTVESVIDAYFENENDIFWDYQERIQEGALERVVRRDRQARRLRELTRNYIEENLLRDYPNY
jgi:hypothetical protein